MESQHEDMEVKITFQVDHIFIKFLCILFKHIFTVRLT